MAQVNITITKVSPRVCLVDQQTLNSATGDKANWINHTGDEVIVFFPHDDVLGAGASGRHFHKQVPKGGNYTHPDPANPAKKGRFPYAIYCSATQNFAIGGSDPEIIVS